MNAAATGAIEGRVLPPRGRVGIVGLILTESAFFGIFVWAYVFYLGKSLSGPTPAEVLELPIVGSICLLSSSVTIMIATGALRRGRVGVFTTWWLATLALGTAFLVTTAREWHTLIWERGLTIQTNLFGTTYYSLVGLHAIHVIVGLILIGLVAVLALRGHVRTEDAERTEVLSWYWHFVDTVWVVVFLTVYVVGR
ncbi:MAG TPA: cytochrome c oxidase subunit 3 [Candidatus Binatia bacterium]|nr:cytochrome c oxidase subunit 3 [Candidatus Binatia bacterium]